MGRDRERPARPGKAVTEDVASPAMRRIVVVGTAGSGKTTVGRRLAEILDIPHIELDAVHWGPNWTLPSVDDFRARVAEALAEECWIADGNYSKVRDITWGRADTLVWLDLGLLVCLWWATKRSLRRIIAREELWNGNRETWRAVFLSDNGIFIYITRRHRPRRLLYADLLAGPEFGHLNVVRLRSPREVERWLSSVTPLTRTSRCL